MTRPPVVGITAYAESVHREQFGSVPVRGVTAAYVTAIERAGGVALLVPARIDMDETLASLVISRLDALVLVGGEDIDAHHFGQSNHPSVNPAPPERDLSELALARTALAADLPVLGVCRGMQVLAVAAGGSLEQHLPDRLGRNDHASIPDGYWPHRIDSVPGTRFAQIMGEAPEVHCHHHQGIDTHPGFVPAAWSRSTDPAHRVLEAMESPPRRFCLGVQSHPEQLGDIRLFAALVAAAQ